MDIRVPPKKYRDKVRKRLELVNQVFADKQKLKTYLQRQGGWKGSELPNFIEWMTMLLETDVPALLDLFEKKNQDENV